ncbi:unnamed protein product [Polarella glacialis]|uniref:Uncharacterized protein n=1 Tax=Polarella glacialis TaxID=89957 RepID=A0A813FTC9_POLGL|nr:unnamed protein product [Polarella glacialis]CAE8613648.1 unnamed protein product [Polarella glacialis]
MRDRGTLSSILLETRHQSLQRSLGEREQGGPHEQIRSKPARLRFTRSCEILHSSLEEPLASWKTLEPQMPHWPSTWRRYHLTDGIRVVDQDTVMIEARDTLGKTQKGLLRSSSGTVTYSSSHRLKVELDVEILAQILGEGIPGGAHAWTPSKLQQFFFMRTGRRGSWEHYRVGIVPFMMLFPKTFDLLGPNSENVRLVRKVGTVVLDNIEDALVRLSRSRETDAIEHHLPEDGMREARNISEVRVLPEVRSNRLKVGYYPSKGDPRSATSTVRSLRPFDTSGGSEHFALGSRGVA